MEEKHLYKFYWGCGRMGSVNSIFVATEEQISKLIGKYVYFGEILGKHSEIYGTIDTNDIEFIDISSGAIKEVSFVLGDTWSGYNPIHYLRKDGEEATLDDFE